MCGNATAHSSRKIRVLESLKFSTLGADAAAAAIGRLQNAAKVATKAMSSVAATLGSVGGSLGQTANQVASFMWSFQQMGALGGIIAGAQIAISKISDHYIKAADAMVAKAREMGDKVRANLDKINQARMDSVNKALEEATTKAKEAATAFDTMAAAYMRVQQAKDATAKSGMTAGMAALNLDKARAMSEAKDDSERALIGADYDVKIAQRQMADTRAAQDAAVADAEDDAAIKNSQAKMARQAERDALAAKKKAEAEYELDVDVAEASGGESRNIEKSKAAKDAAEKAYADAVNDRIRKVAESKAAEQRVIQAQNARTAALDDSERNLIEARDAESRLIDAQKKAAQAELDRADAARRKALADARIVASQKEQETLVGQASAASADVARFGGEFNRAFDLWRDPEAAQQAVDADKKRADDMKAFRKAVNRYGGKAKIDEYAELMRQGDEEGMQSRLEEWRKSSKFTPQVEQMVKAAAADQNKDAAEKSLANIEKNTADLAKKIDELLTLKG